MGIEWIYSHSNDEEQNYRKLTENELNELNKLKEMIKELFLRKEIQIDIEYVSEYKIRPVIRIDDKDICYGSSVLI